MSRVRSRYGRPSLQQDLRLTGWLWQPLILSMMDQNTPTPPNWEGDSCSSQIVPYCITVPQGYVFYRQRLIVHLLLPFLITFYSARKCPQTLCLEVSHSIYWEDFGFHTVNWFGFSLLLQWVICRSKFVFIVGWISKYSLEKYLLFG